MVDIVPLELALIEPAWIDRVPSPAHDSLTPDGRRAVLAANPDSYLAVTRSVEDLGPGTAATAEDVLALGRASLDRLVALGAFSKNRAAQFYAYQLQSGPHVQTGLVGGVATGAFADGGVLIHEQIHHDRSDHLARHLHIVGVQSSPIAVAHLPRPALRSVLDATTSAGPPLLDIESESGFSQRIWPIDPERSEVIIAELHRQPLYLIDGHHRGAAAVQHRATVGAGTADWTLCALFPTDELTNHAFHRMLPGRIDEWSTAAALADLGSRPIHEPNDVVDIGGDEIALFDAANDCWLALHAPPVDNVAPSLSGLAPTRLADRFSRAFGHRWRNHVRYRPGVLSLDQLIEEARDAGDVLFVLPALSIEQLIDVANAGLAMPPKSTYFDPKVRSGVFLRRL